MADLKTGDLVETIDGKAFTGDGYATQYAFVYMILPDKISLIPEADPFNLKTNPFYSFFEKREKIKRADSIMATIAAKKAEYNAKRLADARESFNKFKVGQTVLLIGHEEAPPYGLLQERVKIRELEYPRVRVEKGDGTSENVSFSSLELLQGGARKYRRRTIRRKRTRRT